MKGKVLHTENSQLSVRNEKSETQELKGKMEKDTKMNKKRKKKRKHELNEASTKPEKKIKIEENNVAEKNKINDTDISDHEDEPEVEISKDEHNKFNGKFLRNSFNSAAGFDTLQKFLAICNQDEKKDLAGKYLQAGGSVLEILRLLDSSDRKNTNNITTVFSAMHIILMKILAEYPQNQSNAQEACRHLINSHLASIHSMLSSQSKPKHRKVVLKLLAAVVSLGGTLPRELLNHLTLHSQLLEVLVSHTKPTDPQSVRTCFIHFILAFFIEGNASDIRTLLEKRGVLSSIFAGLIYDNSNVVQLVLTTVKKYILENPMISKTTKLHVFSTPVVQEIVNLYNWKGPKNWSGHKKQKSMTEHIDPEEKEVTVNAVHEFLITLLTSNRHGIAFHDRSLGTGSGRKNNQLINTILQSLDKPWEHEKPSELVVKILTACPDLIKSQFSYTEPFLVPRVSKKWMDVIRFIKEIINGIDVESCLKLCSTDMSTIQITNAVLNLTVPPMIIRNAIIPSLEHDSFLIHHEIINLVTVMIRKVESFMTAFDNTKLNSSERCNFKAAIFEYILKHMPSFESILDVWSKAVSTDTKTQTFNLEDQNLHVEIKDHLLAILNLLQAYSEICPEILLTTGIIDMKRKPTILLTSLHNEQAICEEELTIMKVKALKILLCSNLSGFSLNEEIFDVALSFLITKVGNEDTQLDLELQETIYLLLNRCGIFEEYSDQIEIWINGITYLDSYDDKLKVANWIVKIIKRVSKHTEKYISLIRETQENTVEEIVDANREEDIFNELSERNIEDVKLIAPMLPVNSISLLLYAAIENMKKYPSDALDHYMSIVLIHSLHCQVSSRVFLSLVESLKTPAHKYLNSWTNEDSPNPIKKPFDSNNIFRNISKILLNSSENNKISVKETQLCIEVDNNTLNYQLTKFEIKAVCRMAIFYLTQFLQKANKELPNINVYISLLLSLFIIAKEMEKSTDLIQECAKWLFKHPIILQYFKVVHESKNTAESITTTLVTEIINLFFQFHEQALIKRFMHPYQEKFIMQIKSAVKKYKNSDSKKEMYIQMELIKFLLFNIKTITDLLSISINLPVDKLIASEKSALSIWGFMIPKLIERFITEEESNERDIFIAIPENVLKKIFRYLIELKTKYKVEMNLWEDSLHSYLLKFPQNISVIDERIFTTLIKKDMDPVTIKMLNLFVERSSKLVTAFMKHANNNEEILNEKFFIFSTLASNLNFKWDNEFLNKLYNFYKTDIINFLTEPKADDFLWIRENLKAVAYLIDNSFEPKLCKEACDVILSNGNKLDAVQEEHIQLYQNLFKKSIELKPNALKDFVQVLLNVTVTSLKKDSKNISKLLFLCQTLIESIKTLKLKDNFIFEELNKNYSWPQFTRIILKSSLKITKEDKKNTSFLLKALVAACDVAYVDNSSEEYVKTIFEMTTLHSEFINVMLSNAAVKTDLVELLWTLVKKNRAVMLASHIPLYLASYNATLATSDQIILKILKYYETNGIQLDDYRPYIWGNTAASHYSVKGETDTALWRQPSTSQVLDLLLNETVTNTIKNFPTERNWEYGFTNIINTTDQIYDPAFYLPIFTQLLADNNVIACHKIIHSGALALTLIACSSTCEQVRLAAYTIISRFYFHLDATSSKEKLLWINFIDILRNGIVRTELPLKNIRLNGFVATFLARTCLVMTQPLNPLYRPLQAFLMTKPALDLNTIPELLQLYHSSEIEHQAHRHWILEVIRDGFKIDNDMNVALKFVLFKMLFDFYTSTLSDKLTKNLILQIIRSATKLPKSCTILVNGYGLLPWMLTITECIQKGYVDSITSIIDIVNNIVNVLHETKSKDSHHHLMLVKILLSLRIHFSQSITVECLKTYITVLNKTIINSAVCNAVTNKHMKDVVMISKQLSHDVTECETILQFGCKFVKRKNLEPDSDASLKDTLCKLIITWYSFTKTNN